mgnify:FL=1
MHKRTVWPKIAPRVCEYCHIFYYHRKDTEKESQFKKRKFCSNKCKIFCLSKSRIGKKAHNNRQVKKKCIVCGKTELVSPAYSKSPFCGRKCMAKLYSEKHRGINHWNWQGGITKKLSRNILYEGYKDWRKEVYKRDKYKCIFCGNGKSGSLQAHHIKPLATYKNLILDVSNGATVCKKCHKEIHYGKEI